MHTLTQRVILCSAVSSLSVRHTHTCYHVSSIHSIAQPLLIQWSGSFFVGISKATTKFVECPVVDSVPDRNKYIPTAEQSLSRGRQVYEERQYCDTVALRRMYMEETHLLASTSCTVGTSTLVWTLSSSQCMGTQARGQSWMSKKALSNAPSNRDNHM